MSSILPATVPFQHQVWVADGTQDRHGNAKGHYAEPVDRLAITIYPTHWRNPRVDPISPDYEQRSATDILIEVDDATPFANRDRIIWQGDVFEVQGDNPPDWGQGMPIPGYSQLVGGTVHARRVTSTGVLAG